MGQIKGMSIKEDCLLAATIPTPLSLTSPLTKFRYWNGPFTISAGDVNIDALASSNGGLTWPGTPFGTSFAVAMRFANLSGFSVAGGQGPQRLMNVGNNWISLARDAGTSRWILSVQILNTPTLVPSTTQYKYWKFADIDATKSFWLIYAPSTVGANTTIDVNLYTSDNLLTPVPSTATDTSSTFQYTGYTAPNFQWLTSTVVSAGSYMTLTLSQVILRSETAMTLSDMVSNTQPAVSIDGTTLASGMRVLLTGQTNAVENGIYLVGTTALTRVDDLAAGSLASGNFVFVTSGTANGRKGYVCNALPGAETVGTHALAWTVFTSEDGKIGTTTISGGLITDASGSISLVNNALVTTGPITSGTANVGTTLKLQGGQIFDTTGSISMNATNLSTTGNVAATNVTTGTLSLTSGKLTDSSGTITMVATNLSTTGNVSATHFTTASDERLKEEIRPLVISLNDLDKIRGLRYRWKESQREDTGLLAQEVRQLAPECVMEDPHTSLLQVDYARIVPYLVEWIRILAGRDGPKA